MCGFAGLLGGDWRDADAGPLLGAMARALVHRGPDDEGLWWDSRTRIGLAHLRLSVVDLSEAGHQPMASHGGRFMLGYNGEIYNHLDLRRDLTAACAAPVWRGHSDTETLMAGFEAWGIEATLKRAVGMFAFALWDRQRHELTLARDRVGEKPLYYGWQGRGAAAVFLFGSELKALRAHPGFVAPVNRDALCLLMRHNCIGGSHSIYEGIHKLPAGSLLRVSLASPEPASHVYWSGAAVAEEGVLRPFTGTDTEAVDALDALLRDALRLQMVADVPLGAFLSGGIDSSTVVALMQAQSNRAVKTFSIGFHEQGYNEAEHAKAVATHLGTEHTELYVSSQQAMSVIDRLPRMYDEPFADSSQIPTFLVSELARRHVTVSLSGDAGDELFGGYNRYAMTARLWHQLARAPRAVRRAAAWLLTRIPPDAFNRIGVGLAGERGARLGDRLHRGASALAAGSGDDLYRAMVSQWPDPGLVVIGGREPPTPLTGLRPELAGLSDVERMMALDLLTYLPDDILTKVDRAAMAVSLETRVPFLDHRVVEFAWRLPLALKLRPSPSGHVTKWILRQVLERYVPSSLIDRPKMGFGVPIDSWLRGPLRPWAEELLSESRLRREGFFHPGPIRRQWAEHVSGRRNRQHPLWCVLMFQAWLEANRP